MTKRKIADLADQLEQLLEDVADADAFFAALEKALVVFYDDDDAEPGFEALSAARRAFAKADRAMWGDDDDDDEEEGDDDAEDT